MSEYLLENLGKLFASFGASARPSVFFDYDGTLSAIAERPESAVLTQRMRSLLAAVTRRYPTVVISGRAVDDLMGKVRIETGLVYAGNHGMEIRADSFSLVCDPGRAAKLEIARLRRSLAAAIAGFEGAFVEDKGQTLSVHYRLLRPASLVEDLRTRFFEITSGPASGGLIRVTEGKKVLEVRPPVEWNKGSAVKWIMKRPAFRSTVPLYLGDDETDRDGFSAVSGSGVSVFIGHREATGSGADYHLKSQREVEGFCRWLSGL